MKSSTRMVSVGGGGGKSGSTITTTTTTTPSVIKLSVNRPLSSASRTSSITSISSEVDTNSRIKSSPSTTDILNPDSDNIEIGERLYVNGTKGGIVRFLGETSFAPGRWAGVELDAETGKNDGSVNGIRYFQCQDKHGLFVRPYKLTMKPLNDCPAEVGAMKNTSGGGGGSNKTESVHKSATSKSTNSYSSNMKVGDKVMVYASTGLKIGSLAFLGQTDFAPGTWAGVHLEEATGKNDGSVAGKRYFNCPMNHGLFAPLQKVSLYSEFGKAPSKGSVGVPNIPTSTRRAGAGSGLSKRPTMGSQESISSISSSASRRSGRIKLGVTSLRSSTPSNKSKTNGSTSPATATVAATTSALHQAVKEKEDHITQLLKERELERGDVARVTIEKEELESALSSIQTEYQKVILEKERTIIELRDALEEGKSIQKELLGQIEEEKKRLEELEFRLEEEMVNRMTLKEELDHINQRGVLIKEDEKEMELFHLREEMIKKEENIMQLESSLELKKQEGNNLSTRVKELEGKVGLLEARGARHLATIDELNLKLRQNENRMVMMQEELVEKQEKIERFDEEMRELLVKGGNEGSQITHLMEQLGLKEDEIKSLREELKGARTAVNETVMKLEHVSHQNQELLKQKERQIEDMSMNSVKLSEDLSRKDQELEVLARKLSEACDEKEQCQIKQEKSEHEVEYKEAELRQLQNTMEAKEQEFHVEMKKVKRELNEHENELGLKEKNLLRLEKELARKEEEKMKLENRMDELLKASGDVSEHLKLLKEEGREKQNEINRLKEIVCSLEEQLSKMKGDKKCIEEDLDEIKEKLSIKLGDIEKLLSTREELEEELEDKVNKNLELSTKLDKEKRDKESSNGRLDKMQEELGQKQREVKNLKDSLSKLNEELEEVEREKRLIEMELHDIKNSAIEKDDLIDRLDKDYRDLEEDLRSLTKERNRLREDSDALEKGRKQEIADWKERVSKMSKDLDEYRRKTDEEVRKVNRDQEYLMSELRRDLLSVQKDNERLHQVNLELKKEMEESRNRHQSVLEELEEEVQRYESQEKVKKLEQLEAKEREANMIQVWRDRVEEEKKNLTKKINELQKALTGVRLDPEEGRSQVEFLNSVIVDMQKKNDELKARIAVLEEIGMGEFTLQASTVSSVNGHLSRAPRRFCDICDRFDLHDTEDCPRQAGQMDESHSRHGRSRNEARSYCETCEMFGHSTADCQISGSF